MSSLTWKREKEPEQEIKNNGDQFRWKKKKVNRKTYNISSMKPVTTGADLRGGCRGCAPPPRDDLRFSNTTGILQKKKYVVYWCWSRARDEHPLLKKSWIRPWTRKFLEGSRCSHAKKKKTAKKCTKKLCCTCKVVFSLLLIVVYFTLLIIFTRFFSNTRFYILFE